MKKFQLSVSQKWLVAMIMIALAMVLRLLGIALNDAVDTVESNAPNIAEITDQIQTLKDDINTLEQTAAKSGKRLDSLSEQRDDCVAMIGTLCRNSGLVVNKMSVQEIASDEGDLYALPVKIELQGTLPQVKAFLDATTQTDYLCRIKQLSCRTKQDYSWLWRQVDDDTFIPWWQESKPATEEDPDIAADETLPTTKETDTLSIKTLIAPSPVLCYIELDFLGRESSS